MGNIRSTKISTKQPLSKQIAGQVRGVRRATQSKQTTVQPNRDEDTVRQLQRQYGNRNLQRMITQAQADNATATHFGHGNGPTVSGLAQLQRMVGQHGGRVIQRDPQDRQNSSVTMPPLTVVGSRPGGVEENVAGTDNLRGQGVNPNEMTVTRDEASVRRNSPNPSDPLPFTRSGWDAIRILTVLGQYDRLRGTDSDSTRCVQAVAMASRIPQGPNAVASFLSDTLFDALLVRTIGRRERVAMNILRFVKTRLENRTATFGDLSWAQEALHDLFYNDVSGTPETEMNDRLQPTLSSLSREQRAINVWCSSPADVMRVANTLPPGGQLMVNTWTVLFNQAFLDLEDQGIRVQRNMRVNINGRIVRIRRINARRRPQPRAIDRNRDQMTGHQLLIIRDNTPAATLRLYEPEVVSTGQHLLTLSTAGSELNEYFSSDSSIEMYRYMQIRAQITQSGLRSASTTGTQNP